MNDPDKQAPLPADNDDWLAALSGQPRPGGDRAAQAEATLLRDALRRWPATAPEPTAADEQAQLARLLDAARRDPQLAQRPRCALCAAVRAWGRWLTWPRLAGGAGFVLAGLLAVVLLPQQRPPAAAVDGADTLRGSASEGVQRLRVGGTGSASGVAGAAGDAGVASVASAASAASGSGDAGARALRDRIADELAATGVTVHRYQRDGLAGLDAELPMPPSPALAAVLQRHVLQLPPSGGLAVEVEAAP